MVWGVPNQRDLLDERGKMSTETQETDIPEFEKVLRPGDAHVWTDYFASVFVKIEFSNGRLSITGVHGPQANGNARGGCGQIRDTVREVSRYAPGWDAAMVADLVAIWDRWHLNDLTAGSPRQEEWLREHPIEYTYPESHYGKATTALATAGLNPDTEHVHEGTPYQYGHAWLREDVPGDILERLQAFPDADKTPAWV